MHLLRARLWLDDEDAKMNPPYCLTSVNSQGNNQALDTHFYVTMKPRKGVFEIKFPGSDTMFNTIELYNLLITSQLTLSSV